MKSVLSALALATASAGWAQVTPVPRFTGEFQENFDRFGTTTITHQVSTFGGRGVLRSNDDDTTVHVLLGDTFLGQTIGPRTAPLMAGLTIGPAVFEFSTPVYRFGGFFENNSGANNATARFFGTSGAQLAALTVDVPFNAAVPWTWSGWSSTQPITRIEIMGNGGFGTGGWIWFDDMEISTTPEPGGLGLLALAALARRRSRR